MSFDREYILNDKSDYNGFSSSSVQLSMLFLSVGCIVINTFVLNKSQLVWTLFVKTTDNFKTEGGFLVMAEITRILAANIRGQFFFVISTAASTRCLVQNF